MKVLSLVRLLLVIGTSVAASDDLCGRYFAYLQAYRTKPVVDYIAKTKLWSEGRRDILDWGCGGGALSLALAKRGANNILAVDLSDHAVFAANKRLQSLPNAAAKKPTSIIPWHKPGTINFDSKFDIVVSYRGALSPGTTDQRRIDPFPAVMKAVKACRDGGSVIIVTHYSSHARRLIRTAVLTIVACLAIIRSAWIADLSGMQLAKVSLAAFLLCPSATYHFGYVIGLVHGIMSSRYNKRISFLCGCALIDYVDETIDKWKAVSKEMSHDRGFIANIMRVAGLTDVKVTQKICFLKSEPHRYGRMQKRNLLWNTYLHLLTVLSNYASYPSFLFIYEGTKKRRLNLEETLRARKHLSSVAKKISKQS